MSEIITQINQIRQEYSLKKLDIELVTQNPIEQFKIWLEEAIAAKIKEPTAMNLATVSSTGKPTSRIVLLKSVEENGFVFYTNYKSKKAQQIDANPNVALNFFWAELERQVRIEGKVSKIDEEKSTTYFQSRPYKSQLGALASSQSQVLESRAVLEKKFDALHLEYENRVIMKPENWGGYLVTPLYFEFWQGRQSRLHDRIVYQKKESTWEKLRLAP